MANKQKAILFTILGTVSAAAVAPIAANRSVHPIFIVLPLVFMGFFLFFAGYYGGLSKK